MSKKRLIGFDITNNYKWWEANREEIKKDISQMLNKSLGTFWVASLYDYTEEQLTYLKLKYPHAVISDTEEG